MVKKKHDWETEGVLQSKKLLKHEYERGRRSMASHADDNESSESREDDNASSDDELDMDPQELAGLELINLLGDALDANMKMSAKLVCLICHWAHLGGNL